MLGEKDTVSQLLNELETLRRLANQIEDAARNRIEESGKLLQKILDATPDLLVLKDTNLVYRFVNSAFCRFLGKEQDEIIGKTDYDLFPPEEAEKYRSDDLRVVETKQPQVQEEEVTGASGKKWLYVAKNPVIDDSGQVIGVLCSVRDITVLKQTEEALRENQHFLSNVFSSIQDGISVLDKSLCIIKVNRTVEEWNAQAMPLVGKKCYKSYKGRQEPCEQCPAKEVLETGKPAYETVPKTGPAGEAVGWSDVYAFPLKDLKTGETKGIINYIRDVTERRQKEGELKLALNKLQRVVLQAIQGMARVVERRDAYTAGHQFRVADLACAIADELGFSEYEMRGIQMAALVHDIGKVGVPVEILNKPARLTKTEFELIRNHPSIGFDILKEIEFPWPIAQMVFQHHERLDGSGYPLGLKADEICREAKILAVADVVEAMASHRPYRPALGVDQALEEITSRRGVLYDSDTVDVCVRLFTSKGFRLDDD